MYICNTYVIVISRFPLDARQRRRKKKKKKKRVGNSRLRHAALTRLSSAMLTFALLFARIFLRERVPRLELTRDRTPVIDPTLKFSTERKKGVHTIKLTGER